MENLLNYDGTPSFTNISTLRDNFETSFAKKHLGSVMKDIVIKSMNKIDNSNAEDLLKDEKVTEFIGNGIAEISDKCYTNEELNGSTYIGGLKGLVKEYASMESQYREDLANAILASESDKAKAGGKILELFSTENLEFSNKELKQRFGDMLNSSFSFEAEDIVTEIGKEVGAAIAESEEKNIIINETSKVIEDKRNEIREELSSIDDEDEEDDDTSENDEDYDDSEDDGTATDEPDEEDDQNDETSTEGYEYGIERFIGLSRDERKEALETFVKERPQVIKSFKEFYGKMIKKAKDMNSDQKGTIYMNYDDEKEFAEALDYQFEKLYKKLTNKKSITGNSKGKFTIKLMSIKDINAAKYFISLALSLMGFIIIPCVLVILDEDNQNANKIVKETKSNLNDIMKCKLKFKDHIKNSHFYDDVYLQIKVNLKKLWKAGGFEDYENEVEEIEDRLDETLSNDIENGKVTVGFQDVSVDNLEVTNVAEHIEDGETGENESVNPDQVPTEVTSSTPAEAPEQLTNDTIPEIAATEEYNRLKYSNEYIGRVVVPLSPTRLDSIEIPSAKALGTVYAKSSESLNSLKTVITGRLNLLGDIVEREHDEELTKKFTDYKARALEAFDDALDIQGTFATIGITPYGVEDINDPVNVTIAAKAYKYLSGDLELKNKCPKTSYKSIEDAIDAAFDIAIMKDAARNAKTKDDLISINKDRMSREDLFWNNITTIEADDVNKDQIKSILQFGDLAIDKKALVDTTFLTNIELALDTIGVKKPGQTEDEVHKEIFERSKERIESFLGKDLTYQQLEIIEAMIESRDTSDYAPTPFEKFIIKLGTDKVLEKNGGKDFEIGQESADEIKNKAICCCVLNSFIDKLNPMNQSDTNTFKEYIGA